MAQRHIVIGTCRKRSEESSHLANMMAVKIQMLIIHSLGLFKTSADIGRPFQAKKQQIEAVVQTDSHRDDKHGITTGEEPIRAVDTESSREQSSYRCSSYLCSLSGTLVHRN